MDIAHGLKLKAAAIRSYPSSDRNRRLAELHARLAMPEWAAIRNWLVDNHGCLAAAAGHDGAETPLTQACALAMFVATRKPLTAWEGVSATDRSDRIERIANLSGELAKLLAKTDNPALPVALDLFDVENVPAALIAGLSLVDAPKELLVLRRQQVGPILKRLAAVIARERRRRVRETRPNTGAPNVRALGRETAAWFERQYSTTPYEVIADIVTLATEKERGSMGAGEVREWLRKR